MKRHLDGRERGASVVEYALLIALISVVSIGAIKALGDSSSDRFDDAASAIGVPGSSENTGGGSGGGGSGGGSGGGGSSGGGSGGGGGGGGGTTTTTTTTTAPPASSTTTLPDPEPSTPTIPPSVPVETGFEQVRAVGLQGNSWKAEATVVLRDAAGRPLHGTATVRVTIYSKTRDDPRGESSVEERQVTFVHGRGYVFDDGLDKKAGNRLAVHSVTYEVIEVKSSDSGTVFEWSTPQPRVTIAHP